MCHDILFILLNIHVTWSWHIYDCSVYVLFINRVLHFESGHVRYRKPSPPITTGGRIRPSLTRFLRIEPDFIFLGRFGTFPLLCHVDMPNGRLAYVLPLVTYSTRFSTVFILPWFVCTRMDIVPCAGAMYNISDRNEPFPFHCGPFPFFWTGLHTEWSFGLCFRLPWPIAHVFRLFSP